MIQTRDNVMRYAVMNSLIFLIKLKRLQRTNGTRMRIFYIYAKFLLGFISLAMFRFKIRIKIAL